MFLKDYLLNPVIKPFVREIDAGAYLFRQGQAGNSMYVILDGIAQLYDESQGESHLIGTFGPGQFFGEKAMLPGSAHQRMFSAQALIQTTALEVELADVAVIQSVIPDFMTKMFQLAAQRLDRTYQMIRVLRSPDDLEKIIHCILYFYRCPGLEGSGSRFVSFTIDDLHYLSPLTREQITSCLDQMIQQGIIVKRPNDCYHLRDERKLILALSTLVANRAA